MCVIFLVVNHHISIWLPQTSGMVWTLQQQSMTCVCLRNSHSQLLLYAIWFEFLFSNWQIYKFLNATMWMCRLKWSNMVFNEIHSNAANKWILLCIWVRPNRESLNRHIDISMCTISEAARISHIVILSTKTGFWNRTLLSKELKISSKSAANAIVDSINRNPKSIEGTIFHRSGQLDFNMSRINQSKPNSAQVWTLWCSFNSERALKIDSLNGKMSVLNFGINW